MKQTTLHNNGVLAPAMLLCMPVPIAAATTVLTGGFGTILLKQVNSGRFTVRHYHCFINTPSTITGIVNEPHPFLCVNLKGTVVFDYEQQAPLVFYEWACNCLYQPAAEGAVTFRKRGEYSFFTVHFPLEEMNGHLTTHLRVAAFIQAAHIHRPAVLCKGNFAASKIMRNAIADILYINFTNSPWLELTLQELLSYFITLSAASLSAGATINEYDAEAIYKVKEKLLNELHDTPLLSELAASVNLSEYKLKTGFKQVYGMSWIDFLHEARMKKAYDLVGYTRLPYYEIADRVGYQSLPTFINKFRENVGLSPKRFRDTVAGL